MFESEKLYYSDPEAVVSESKVLEIRAGSQGWEVILSSTIFYPEGGGQPCDLGTIGGSKVVAVSEGGHAVVHTVEGEPSFSVGDTVALAIDGGRRRDHSQQHSGQHLLSAVLEREYGIHTIGFHLGGGNSTIDVSCPELNAARVEKIESTIEEFIVRNVSYTVHTCPPEDPSSFLVRKKLPVGEEVIRIVEIGGYDWVACCGTHVKSAGVLRMFKILYTEKYKGNTRVYFVAGDRAVALMKRQSGLLGSVAGSLGTSVEEVPGRVVSLLARSEEIESDRKTLIRDRALLEIDREILRTPLPTGDGKPNILSFSYDDRDSESTFETVKAGALRGLTVVAVSIPGKAVCVMTPRPENVGSALKSLLQEFGGRGGGGANNFRAVFESAENAKSFASKVVALLG